MSSLDSKLTSALASRDERRIRRSLPDPSTSTSESTLIDFNSNDYLSLSSSPALRNLFLSRLNRAPDVLGSGGSRLLVNGRAHSALETRLALFFDSPAALLFNSGFDANVGFFSCIPQQGDAVVYDEYIHASVHEGIRASRACQAHFAFSHNSVPSLQELLVKLRDSRPKLCSSHSSVFVAVESLYSMDGTFAPLQEIADTLEEIFPNGNAYLVVDEAHSTGIYGSQGQGRVAHLGLQNKVLARLHTFGKALAATGAVILTNKLIREYLVNYARSLIYTTSLSFANIIAVDCSFDMLMNGTAHDLASKLLNLSDYFVHILRLRLIAMPSELLSLPAHLQHPRLPICPIAQDLSSPIIPLMTPHPRSLSAFLLTIGMNTRPITWPTVPKGKDRVRVCLHSGNTREDVERLVEGVAEWVKQERMRIERVSAIRSANVLLASKL